MKATKDITRREVLIEGKSTRVHTQRVRIMKTDNMVKVIAGVFVTGSVILGMTVSGKFLWFTLFVGLNLTQYAFTDFCPLATVLRWAGLDD